MDKNDEQILVIKSSILFVNGKWQGLKTDNLEYYLDLIKKHAEFKRRGDVENDDTYQQIIPYMLFSYKDNFFAYRYLAAAGEQRLVNNNYQLGVGGHINKDDVNGEGDILEVGAMREWEEEVHFKGKFLDKKLVGIIKDETNSVERVHVALVYHFVGDSPEIYVEETEKMEGKLMSVSELGQNVSHSPWMQIVYNQYLNKPSPNQKTFLPTGKGKFYVFEGIDGCGKSTQTKLLAEYFKSKGYQVERIDFPQHGQRSSAMVDDYLTGKYGTADDVGAKVASIFYATDRFDASFKIKKWLDEGKVVVADRYLVSNIGHQGGKVANNKDEWKKYVSWLYELEYNVFKIPKPDMTFILKTSVELSLKMSNKITDPEKAEKRKSYLGDDKKQDIHEQSRNHLKNTLNSYLMAAEEFPNDFKVVECLENGEMLLPTIINEKVISIIENTPQKIVPERRIYALPNNLMPEVKAVTFAKCSRSPDAFDKIAAELTEEKSAEFNEKWVVGFGHSSIAEHAVISLAVENVSNIATKMIEDSRLASFTEKSSRYQIFSKDKMYLPESVMNSELKEVYLDAINSLMDVYEELTPPMMDFVKVKYPKPADQSALGGEKLYNMISKARACDSLRYLLPSAALTNLGMTINARELERLIIKLLSHPLKEMQDIGEEMKKNAVEAVPTLIKFADKNNYIIETKKQLKNIADWELGREAGNNQAVVIVDYDKDAQDKLIAGILYPYSNLSYEEIMIKIRSLSQDKKEKIIDEALIRRDKFDQPLREFEHIYYTFDILMDYGAFRDVQRHRMCTQSNQPVTIVHGYDLPPEIREAGFEDKFRGVVEKSADAFVKIYEKFPDEAQYVVPMCFRKRVLITWNLRELHHFISLRSGKKGHQSYRRIAQQCWRELNKIQPLLAKYIRCDMDEMSVSWAASLENKDFYYNPYAARNKQ